MALSAASQALPLQISVVQALTCLWRFCCPTLAFIYDSIHPPDTYNNNDNKLITSYTAPPAGSSIKPCRRQSRRGSSITSPLASAEESGQLSLSPIEPGFSACSLTKGIEREPPIHSTPYQ
ncbi:hypothetical protein V8C44DRAFT_334839 [Trichoderma aethiopicum]